MQKHTLRKYLMLLLTVTIFVVVHESIHILAAIAFGEFKEFHLKPYGFEVEFKTQFLKELKPNGE